MAIPSVLSRRAIGRATLARQMLLRRATIGAAGAIESLVCLQAQQARPPFIGLWSRVAGFRKEELVRLLRRRAVVRATLLRGTLHLVSTRDFLRLRMTIQPALDRALGRGRLAPSQLEAALALGREFFAEPGGTFDAFRNFLERRHSKTDVRSMAYAVRMTLPLVQMPSGNDWGFAPQSDFLLASAWLSKPMPERAEREALVLRYLEAFGPATPRDAQTWSGLPGLKETFDSLRGRLRVFKSEDGGELFDAPRAPRPDPAVEAPARFLPEYDNLIVSHADRTRLVAEEHRSRLVTKNLIVPPTFLVDGIVSGTWGLEVKKNSATLVVTPFAALGPAAREELAHEGAGLLAFLYGEDVKREVRFKR